MADDAAVAEPEADEYAPDLQAIGKKYPALKEVLKNTEVKRGTPSGPDDDRQLEFYQPWDTENPTPGKATVELFSDAKGKARQELIAADLLHHLGSVDPATGKPVDQKFFDLKTKLGSQRTPDHEKMDQEAYASEKASPYGAGEYKDWDSRNRLDAYVRGGLFPDANPEWKEGIFTPDMDKTIGKMREYLTTGKIKTSRKDKWYDGK